jgi:hypothetical protein
VFEAGETRFIGTSTEDINSVAAQVLGCTMPIPLLQGIPRRAGHERPVLCVELPSCVAIHMAKRRRASV